ncbi:MAG: SWIM zinc finger family protein [Treponema sp.]|nr:SWIM zinc finger family protein [Treponema sp.]
MYGTGIIDLREVSPDKWRAKYKGNYGVYTIAVTTKEANAVSWSCTCPSDYDPCKHIGMILDAIAERTAKHERGASKPETRAEHILRELNYEDLLDFAIGIVRHNPDLSNQVTLRFAHLIETEGNKYTAILRDAFDSFELDDEGAYYDSEDWPTIDFMDEWLEKADAYIAEEKYPDAVLIAKACLEELARWIYRTGVDAEFGDYQEHPFSIFKTAAEHSGIDKKELYHYCIEEMAKKKYSAMRDSFNDLLSYLAPAVDPEGFLSLMDKQFAAVNDKSSWEAEKILNRKIALYRDTGRADAAWDLIKNNLQIGAFHEEWVEQLIAEKHFTEAKSLIREVIIPKDDDRSGYHNSNWEELLLKIAREEDDRSEIRRIVYKFIKNTFSDEYYRIYKAAFDPEEWPAEKERLAANYGKHRGYDDSLAALYHAEGDMPALFNCIEKWPSLNLITKYHRALAAVFPEKTLALFRKAVDAYADSGTGRSYYEEIARLLKNIAALPGGEKAAREMIARYRLVYKNRRAMMEILAKAFGPAP